MLKRRQIQATFTLCAGGKNSVIELNGYRCEAIVDNVGTFLTFGTLNLRIWGMRLTDMNRLSTNPLKAMGWSGDSVKIVAGDEGGALHQIFEGTILRAWADFAQSPEVSFNVFAQSATFDRVKVIAPNSYKGAVSVADSIEGIAKRMGYAFKNHNVTTLLNNAYVHGSGVEQIERLVHMAGIVGEISNKKIEIWPNESSKKNKPIVLNAVSGMVGYPSFQEAALHVDCLFNPDISYGSMVKIETAAPYAAGDWKVFNARHDLASEIQGGAWFTKLMLNNSNYRPLV